MKNFKEFNKSMNEELNHSTYKRAASKLKKLGHRSRSKNMIEYADDKYKNSNDIVQYMDRHNKITTTINDIDIQYDRDNGVINIRDLTYNGDNNMNNDIIVTFNRYSNDGTYQHTTYMIDRKSVINVDKLIKRFLNENDLDIDLNYTINSLYREYNPNDSSEKEIDEFDNYEES